MSGKTNTKQLTVCAMLVALGEVLLGIGSIMEIADISMAVLASLLCVIAVIEYGGSAPWLVFAATATLAFLLPNKGIALIYAAFFGYYPILKEKIERLSRVKRWVLKELVFHVALVALIAAFLLAKSLFFPLVGDLTPTFLLLLVLLAEIVFVLYDIALTRLISLYLFRIRPRLRLK